MTPNEIETHVRALISAQISSMGVEVTTPVLYPNGDCIQVYVAKENDYFIVHDAGLAEWYIANEGVQIDRATRTRFSQAVERYGCKFESGRVRLSSVAADIGAAIAVVANGVRAISDFVVEIRRQSDGQFRFVLTESVREVVGARLRENETFKGQSGTSYRVANVVLNEAQTAPIGFVLPLPTRSVVASQFRELYDLKAAFPHIIRDSVYNDASDFRDEQDGWALRQVGELTPFSQIKVQLPKLLARAA